MSIRNLWSDLKSFFNRSTTIFYARFQALTGFVLAVLGSLDWSQISTWDFATPNQTAWLGIGLIVNGVITEVLRRRKLNSNAS